MKFSKQLLMTILMVATTIVVHATAYPCFTAFQATIAAPAAAYAAEQECCPDNSWYHLESQLSWNQSLDEAVDNYDKCCESSDELGC